MKACLTLTLKNQIANPITLKTWMAGDADLARVGGDSYLARLAGSAASIINAGDYGRLIYDLHLRRELIALGEDMVNSAFRPDPDASATDSRSKRPRQKLFNLSTEGRSEGGFQPFNIILLSAIAQAEAAHKREGKLSGTTSGFRDLDAKLGGLHPSDLIILAARPSMGKTALATNIAVNAARALRTEQTETGETKTIEGAMVAFFSLEMSREQLATRVLSEVAEIPSHKIRQGQLSHEEFGNLVEASKLLTRLPLYIDDTPALSVSAVRTRARRLKRTQGLGLIIIDYLQLLAPTGGKRIENRVQEVSDVTRALKALAKELDTPVVALSQLSRAVEQRDDKRPQLADLRESGSIEQDADVVMFIFREEYYLNRAKPEEGSAEFEAWQEKMTKVYNEAEVIIGKQRHGPDRKRQSVFDGQFTKFGNLNPIATAITATNPKPACLSLHDRPLTAPEES